MCTNILWSPSDLQNDPQKLGVRVILTILVMSRFGPIFSDWYETIFMWLSYFILLLFGSFGLWNREPYTTMLCPFCIIGFVICGQLASPITHRNFLFGTHAHVPHIKSLSDLYFSNGDYFGIFLWFYTLFTQVVIDTSNYTLMHLLFAYVHGKI